MRRSSKSEKVGKVCIPIIETTIKNALQAIKKANRVADLIELRVDFLKKPELTPLLKEKQRPFIITLRRKEEGGRYRGDEKGRMGVFNKAIDLGTEYVDVEMKSDRSLLQNLIENKNGTKVILSFHDFRGTPSPTELKGLFDRMMQWGADVIKVVTFARSWEDNLTVLSLVPYASARRQKIVTFCMGEKGKMSRVFSPMMGAAWTYAALSEKQTSAPGQLTVEEIKEIWKRLK
jgi:3-dehydroquinate dehydratase type I